MKKFSIPFVYSLISLFVYFFIPPSQAVAAGEFQADYTVQYAIAPTGTTIVTQNITLTNKQTNLYPQKYSILLDTTKVKNVIAYGAHEIIATDISQQDGKTQILLTFTDKVVGLGKQLAFTLRFENNDIAQQNGNIWEVNIPGITPDADIASYNVSLSVPQSFGPNAYMTPLPASGSIWTKEQMMAGGISAAYGTSQSFDAHLSYYLANPTVTSARMSVALPPNTAYQTVYVESITPKPDTVTRDTDGNWLAEYVLLPETNISIETALHIDVGLRPKDTYTDPMPDIASYTGPLTYWETQNPKITALAATYKTPRAIYEYVTHALSYDYSRVQSTPVRKGAVLALASPKNSICMEFTDLFIAVARAAGIPAREAVGYAYTTNSKLRPLSLVADVLHAWPEYYDVTKKIWVAVDPTWANTTGGVNYFDKMDFNHIVFAIHGKSSDYPYPAGFYRKAGKTTRDVAITFATAPFTTPTSKLSTSVSFPALVTAGITARGQLTVENTTGVEIPSADITIQSTPVDIALATTVPNIPPFAKIVIPLNMTVPNYFTGGSGRFIVNVNGASQETSFRVQPITTYFIIPILSFGGILIILSAMMIHQHILWKRHKKH